jgi:nicotinamidase/pyrazinamidase
MSRVLVDVDTQVDFVAPRGALHVPAPDGVRESIEALLRTASEQYDAVVGSVDSHAYDAWEFAENGGPFPAHCVKGTPGWLRVWHDLPRQIRFVPMCSVESAPSFSLEVGENVEGGGNRRLDAGDLVREARAGVGIYFEKEVYSLFSNPAARVVIDALVSELGGKDEVVFDVIGYCTGGYCVDGAALGLVERGYRVRIFAEATAAIGGDEGVEKTRQMCLAKGIDWVPRR